MSTTTTNHPSGPAQPGGYLTASPSDSYPFTFPREHSFPPFYTRQPIPSTYHAQLQKWSSLILAYCASQKIYKLPLQPTHVLFTHPSSTNLHLTLSHLREICDHMRNTKSLDYIPPASSSYSTSASQLYPTNLSNKAIPDSEKTMVWIYWKSIDEWGDRIWEWVDSTGQKGSVLTVYELIESESINGRDWEGMDEDFLKRVLQGLEKRGKATLFSAGGDGGLGVKFF